MASNLDQYDSDLEEEDYINMEVSSFTNLIQKTLQNKTKEFEFQMSHLCPLNIDKTTSPADELFYKGKLLPLHLPPRLQMVQKLLEDYSFDDEASFTTPAMGNTPFESCNVSPVESCQVSQELNPKDYFLECLVDEDEVDEKKKSWIKKRFISKIKASRAYIRSLFGKSGCSDESSCASAAKVADEGSVLRYSKVTENPTKLTRSHRRSFSVSMRRQPANSLVPKSSSNSLGFRPLQLLKRSTSSEIENSIQGAILHCKQSLQVTDDQERAQLFRG